MSPHPLLLVVDDNRDNAALLARRLRRHDFNVVISHSGEKALKLIDSENIDLVLLDILMRDMDSMQTLATIRRRYSPVDLPVIMATALADSRNMVDALESGANDYVVKPLDMDVVIARIRNQLTLKNRFLAEKSLN